MKFYKIFLFYNLIIFSNCIYSQDTIWNVLRKGIYADNDAIIIFESDSFYTCISTSVDSFIKTEQGISLTSIDKKKSLLTKTLHYEEYSVELINNRLNKIILEGNEYFFAQQSDGRIKGISLFKINDFNNTINKIITIETPVKNEWSYMFLNDILSLNEHYYIMTTILTKENNEPLIIKVNKNTLDYTYIRFKDKLENITSCKLLENKDGILGLFNYYGKEIVSGGHYFIQFDLEGNILWEYRSPTDVPNWFITSVLPLNDDEILFSSYDDTFNFNTFLTEARLSVTRFNTKTKKSIYHTWWDAVHKPYMPAESKIIIGHKDKEYMLMCGDYIEAGNYTEGRVVKFDENGKRIWKKNYVYFAQNNVNNIFTDIIATSDGNYLMCGYNGLGRSNWLVKINEDGDILKIDTTTTVSDVLPFANVDIKIYPNPTAGMLIVDQGDINEVEYRLHEMKGNLVRSIVIKESDTNAVWDISDLDCGMYNIIMHKEGKVIGSSKIVLER